MNKKIAVIGAGNMGTAMAQILAENGHRVCIWDIDLVVLQQIAKKRTNQKQLPGIKLHSRIVAMPNHVECIKDTDTVLLAVPSQAMNQMVKKIKPLLGPKMIIFSVSKGLDKKTLWTTAEQIMHSLPKNLKKQFVNMTGPAIASEFVRHCPTAVEVASLGKKAPLEIKNILQNKYLKVVISKDLVGSALCASLKNTYAILFGIAQGQSYALNTKALMFALACQEMKNILAKIGTSPQTAFSLSGIGDMAVTGFNPKSRNVTYGKIICQKGVKSPEKLGLKQVAEGYFSTPLLAKLMRKKKIKAPLIFLVDAILKKKKNPKAGLKDFLEKL